MRDPDGPVGCALFTAEQRYGPGFGLHTRTSGRIDRLTALYVRLEDRDGRVGVGEVRTNIAYLHGLPAERVLAAAVRHLPGLPWRAGARAALEAFDRHRSADSGPGAAARPLRMALETAVRDLQARRAGVPVAALFGGPARPVARPTNQSLAWTEGVPNLVAEAERYVARGFTRLKVRLGLADPAADRARLAALRDRFGAAVSLAADLNGVDRGAAVERRLEGLAPFALDYVEQPCAADDWETVARLARGRPPVTVMLDETVGEPDAVQRLADLGWTGGVHLKAVKLGGIDRVVAAGRLARAAGMTVMVGQMNEGAVATAAALAAAQVLSPDHDELYGADGLADEPGAGIVYGPGTVTVVGAAGLGVTLDTQRCRALGAALQEETTDVG